MKSLALCAGFTHPAIGECDDLQGTSGRVTERAPGGLSPIRSVRIPAAVTWPIVLVAGAAVRSSALPVSFASTARSAPTASMAELHCNRIARPRGRADPAHQVSRRIIRAGPGTLASGHFFASPHAGKSLRSRRGPELRTGGSCSNLARRPPTTSPEREKFSRSEPRPTESGYNGCPARERDPHRNKSIEVTIPRLEP
jgi:hypothetical protein